MYCCPGSWIAQWSDGWLLLSRVLHSQSAAENIGRPAPCSGVAEACRSSQGATYPPPQLRAWGRSVSPQGLFSSGQSVSIPIFGPRERFSTLKSKFWSSKNQRVIRELLLLLVAIHFNGD